MAAAFQAEYEGSIPFTRSSLSTKDLARGSDFILTNGLLYTFRYSPSDRLFRVSLDTLSFPRTALDRLRCELIKTEYLGLEKRY